MKIGSKSLLFGAHQFALHPLFLALVWRKLYGSFPRDPRIWLAFVVHDWGYWGCPNMDGEEGKYHPWRAARWFAKWLDAGKFERIHGLTVDCLGAWGKFCLLHSRSIARRYHEPVSDLCAPDKVAAFLMPRWLYIKLTGWTGELEEYMAEADTQAGRDAGISIESPEAWFDSVKAYLDFVAEQIVAGGDPGVPPTRSEHLHGSISVPMHAHSAKGGRGIPP